MSLDLIDKHLGGHLDEIDGEVLSTILIVLRAALTLPLTDDENEVSMELLKELEKRREVD